MTNISIINVKKNQWRHYKGQKTADEINNSQSSKNTNTNTTDKFQDPTVSNTDYDNICSSDEGVKRALNIISTIISIVKWVAPLLIIILGIVDFARASLSDDEQAINNIECKYTFLTFTEQEGPSFLSVICPGNLFSHFDIDGLRFDLMGLHDLETMEQISNNDKTYVCIKCALNIDECSKQLEFS